MVRKKRIDFLDLEGLDVAKTKMKNLQIMADIFANRDFEPEKIVDILEQIKEEIALLNEKERIFERETLKQFNVGAILLAVIVKGYLLYEEMIRFLVSENIDVPITRRTVMRYLSEIRRMGIPLEGITATAVRGLGKKDKRVKAYRIKESYLKKKKFEIASFIFTRFNFVIAEVLRKLTGQGMYFSDFVSEAITLWNVLKVARAIREKRAIVLSYQGGKDEVFSPTFITQASGKLLVVGKGEKESEISSVPLDTISIVRESEKAKYSAVSDEELRNFFGQFLNSWLFMGGKKTRQNG